MALVVSYRSTMAIFAHVFRQGGAVDTLVVTAALEDLARLGNVHVSFKVDGEPPPGASGERDGEVLGAPHIHPTSSST